MKSIQFNILLICIAILVFSCNDPKTTDCVYIDKRLCDPNFSNDILVGVVDFDQSSLIDYDEKIYLEEFTGFKCTNCPAATATAKNLQTEYEGRLHIAAIHCTKFFAAPDTDDPDEPFHKDFRTPEGEIYYDFYQPPGLPDGVIDRFGTENTPTISFNLWAERLQILMGSNDPECYLEFGNVTFNEDSTVVQVIALAKPIELINDRINLNVAALENGIAEAQKTIGNETLYDYIHDHVFRTTSHGAWGTFGFDGDLLLEANEILQFEFTIPLDEEWSIENLELIFYASRESNREVIQSEYYSF